MIEKSFSTSARLSAEVGSSMTMRRDFIESARAISTICCSATERSRTSARGLRSRPMRRAQRCRLLFQLAAADEEARAGLAADEDVLRDRHVGREGEFLVDGDDARAPARPAGWRSSRASPANAMVPASGCCAPDRIFRSVDLPAPFSPRKRMDLAGADLEVDAVERPHAGKGLGNPRHAQKRCRAAVTEPSKCRPAGHVPGRTLALRCLLHFAEAFGDVRDCPW